MKRILIGLCSVVMLLSSCIDDVPDSFSTTEMNWNPSISIAAGYTSLGMNEESGFNMDLLNDGDFSGFPDWMDEIDLEMQYKMPFDMEEINDFSEEIVRVMFRINVANGFPAETYSQVYFLDNNENVVDSVYANGALTFNPANANSQGEITKKTKSQNDIIFSNDKVDELSTVKNLLIKGGINNLSLDTSLVDYYPNYTLDVQMGMQVELKISVSDSKTQQTF